MTPSAATQSLRDHAWQSFARLEAHGLSAAAGDGFERFLQAPGTLCRPSLIVRCQRTAVDFEHRVVVDKAISRPRLERSLVPFLRRLHGRTRGPCDFFVLVSDNVYVEPARVADCLGWLERVAFLRCDRWDGDPVSARGILIPDFMLQDAQYAGELEAVERAADGLAFAARAPIIKWRGRLSGPDYPTIDNCASFPRYTLLLQSLAHPEMIDARLTHYANLEGSAAADALKHQIVTRFGEPSPKLAAADFVAYKYLLSVDGAVSAWKRVPTILASGSVLLLQHRWTQFFYPALEPWRNYVPVALDLGDLGERYAWLEAHPDEARAIGARGRELAREVLRPAALDAYFVDVLERCARLYRA